MLWRKECILTCYVKLVIVNIVKEHVDPAQVVCSKVDLLPEEPLSYIVFAKYLCSFQEQ